MSVGKLLFFFVLASEGVSFFLCCVVKVLSVKGGKW